MNIYRFLSLALCPVFIFQLSLATPAANAVGAGFKAQDVAMMNGFRNTHKLFKTALSGTNTPPRLAAAMTAQLAKKNLSLSEFKLMTDGTVQFQLQNKNHIFSREAGNRFRLDGKLIDLNSKEWSTDVSFQVLPPSSWLLVIPTANAEITLGGILIAAALVFIVMAVACSAPNPKTGGAKRIRVQDIRQTMCKGGCGLACAATVGGEFDLDGYLNEICAEVAKKYPAAEDVERSSQEYERVVNGRQARRTLLLAEVSRVNYQRSHNLTLDTIDQQILSTLITDPETMKSCVLKTLTGAQGAAPHQPNREPAIVPTNQ